MRLIAVFLIGVLIVFSPTAEAHESINHVIEIRESSIEPVRVTVLQNDTLSFYNLVNQSRTISIGDIWECYIGAYDPEKQDDECHLWLDKSVWDFRNLSIIIDHNETIIMQMSVTILEDNHTESAPPDEGFELPRGIRGSGSSEDFDIGDLMLSGALVSFGVASLLWLGNRGDSK